ncbi:MAG: cytochrome C oxidase subunit IV family protein [Candidatus Sericytochromatia bacterium]|nr:cytochrome C oxidase subunit IV family protein [Candidatus Tanganyikabacteria bacterium]
MAHEEGLHHSPSGEVALHGGSHGHAESHGSEETAHGQGQQHPLKIYLNIWGLLFVLSAASYLVDYFHVQGYLRWTLIVLFMLLKAGLIIAVFMHMVWERLSMVYAILVPVTLVLTFIGIGAFEGRYTFDTRTEFFAPGPAPAGHGSPHGSAGAPAHGKAPSGDH